MQKRMGKNYIKLYVLERIRVWFVAGLITKNNKNGRTL